MREVPSRIRAVFLLILDNALYLRYEAAALVSTLIIVPL